MARWCNAAPGGSEATPAVTHMYERKGTYRVAVGTIWTATVAMTGPGVVARPTPIGSAWLTVSADYPVIEVRSDLTGLTTASPWPVTSVTRADRPIPRRAPSLHDARHGRDHPRCCATRRRARQHVRGCTNRPLATPTASPTPTRGSDSHR